MKNLKPKILITILVILISADLFALNAFGDSKSKIRELHQTESSILIKTRSDNKLLADNFNRSSSLNRVIAELNFIVEHPEAFLRVSGYNVYPD